MSVSTRIRIGRWTAIPALNLLESAERSVKIEPRTMNVLAYLASRPGEVVSVDELLTNVWRGVVVGDGSVYLAIKQLRQAFASTCDVPALSSKMITELSIKEFQVSLYFCVQVPGTPPLPGAVSMYKLPESLRMRRNLWLVEL